MKLNIAYVIVLIAAIMTPSAFADTVTTEIDSVSYEIEYSGNNVSLKSATADLDFISLIFETEVTDSEANISITFLRDFFDAKIGIEIDDDFFILSDGDEIQFEEIKDDDSRTLSFSLSPGTEEIEIIGTLLASNSFLLEQQQKEIDVKAKAESDAEAKAKAEANAKLAEEERLQKQIDACGDGTIYENGECVLSPMEKNSKNVNPGPLIYSIVIGLMIGITITLILWGIGKRSHKVLSDSS